MKRNDLVKTLIIMLSTVIATVGLALLLNLVTGQKIAQDAAKREELASQQAAGELLQVLPGATGFEDITATLTIAAESGVSVVHKETSGKGYVFIAHAKFGDMKELAKVTVGVDSEGKIAGILVAVYGNDFYPGIANEVENIRLLMNGNVGATSCNHCSYCLPKKKIERPIHFLELEGELN